MLNRKSFLIKTASLTIAGTVLFSSIGYISQAKAATPVIPVTSPTSTNNAVAGQLTQADINYIKSNDPSLITGTGKFHANNWVTAIAKKLAASALRYSAPWVERGLARVIGTKYAARAARAFYKVAYYIEEVGKIQQLAIAQIFVGAGLPPDIASHAAWWIVLFFGL